MRSHNTTVLLHLAWQAGEISRIELARRSGLAPSTVSKMVGELLEMGLVEESHAKRTKGGRPPIVLRFRYDRFLLLGADLGATHVSVALTDLSGQVLGWRSAPHPVQTDPMGALELILAQTSALLEECEADWVVGMGLGVPSPVDPEQPDVLSERILPHWEGIQPARWLAQRLRMPVLMDNDANLCALAEVWHGAGRGLESLAYIKLGTGIGAGLIVDGEILHGANGFAGEIGHTAIDSSGPRCSCGLQGCLQAMVGSAAVLEQVRLHSGRSFGSLSEVAKAARDGDEAALAAVRQAGRYLGIAIANLFNLMNPSRVVLGGGLTTAGEELLRPLRDAIRERTLWAAIARADVVVGELGERAAAQGAATLLLRAALDDPGMFTDHPTALVADLPPMPRRVRAQETP